MGQTIRFLCEAAGNPSPQLNWLINGRPIKGNFLSLLMCPSFQHDLIPGVPLLDLILYLISSTDKCAPNLNVLQKFAMFVVGHGGSVVSLVPCIQKVAGLNLTPAAT